MDPKRRTGIMGSVDAHFFGDSLMAARKSYGFDKEGRRVALIFSFRKLLTIHS